MNNDHIFASKGGNRVGEKRPELLRLWSCGCVQLRLHVSSLAKKLNARLERCLMFWGETMARSLLVCLVALIGGVAFGQTSDQELAMAKLERYCRGCHGLGALRFIVSDDDESNWRHISEQRAPNSGRLWLDAIIEVLDWPSEEPPPFDDFLEPPGRDWMPKGSRRLELATDTVEGEPARSFLLRILEERQRNLP